MGSHPINLAIRFLLEITALLVIGIWGWKLSDSWIRFFLAIVFPTIIAAIWGTFAVPNDPSRSGAAPIVVHGIVRLAIELGIFALTTWTLYDLGTTILSWIFGVIVVIHYIISYDRILWLIKH